MLVDDGDTVDGWDGCGSGGSGLGSNLNDPLNYPSSVISMSLIRRLAYF
jgi:hypothetical protein